jgi:glycosyltransferase involved in cell wall biosynthesis
MNVLFIHQNFPGQFVNLVADLSKRRAHTLVALSVFNNPVPKGVTLRRYTLLREAGEHTHSLLRDEENKVLHAEAAAAAALQLKREGFEPDLIVAHPGWGEALFMKDVFPDARLVIYCEYYYALHGQDVGFDPEVPSLSLQQRYRLRLKNATNLLSMEIADAAYSPTQWQRGTYPSWAQEKIAVIHDGIDMERLAHRPAAQVRLAANAHHPELTFKPGDEVLTYVARNLEPIRGFQMLMRMLPNVLRQRRNAHVLVIGGDDVSYGSRAPNGTSWREQLVGELGQSLDHARVHFVGRVSDQVYLDVLSISKLHVYWTTPFVLSWSFLEAATAGVPMIASATPPVEEFAKQLGVDTVDFFDISGFSDAVIQRLASPDVLRHPKKLPQIESAHCVKAMKGFLGLD